MALSEYLNIGNKNEVKDEIERKIHQIRIKPEITHCVKCGEELKFYYSEHERTIILLDCDLIVVNEVYKCPNPKCKSEKGKWLTYKSSEVGTVVLPKHRYGIDVLLKIGDLRFQEKYTLQKIHDYLYRQHGILIEKAEIYRYQLKYLELFQGYQEQRKEKIKEQLLDQGGWILAIDGTRSNKSKTLYIARDEIHGINLDAQILRKGNPEDLEKFISSIIKDYGRPIAAISDAEWGLFSTLKKLLPDIPIQYCQRHFLVNLGDDLMGDYTTIINKEITYKIKKKIN